ncbi:hypothetical protein WK71_29785 [Burkholderia ubonensis]|nr:hypothetical protein WK71_29785 [Burkholderia ubonensis]KVU90817.1 hypothetical protein WK74_04290 [Burkholderia ubonensis]
MIAPPIAPTVSTCTASECGTTPATDSASIANPAGIHRHDTWSIQMIGRLPTQISSIHCPQTQPSEARSKTEARSSPLRHRQHALFLGVSERRLGIQQFDECPYTFLVASASDIK